MLKARSGKNIILGLEKENIKKIKQDKPIKVKGSDLGLDVDIFIFYGNDIQDLQDKIGVRVQ